MEDNYRLILEYKKINKLPPITRHLLQPQHYGGWGKKSDIIIVRPVFWHSVWAKWVAI